MGSGNDMVDADTLCNAHGRGVDGARQGLARGDQSLARVVEIVRRIIGYGHRSVVDAIVRIEARLDRREIDEGLECRARLSLGIGCAIELAVAVIAAAD